MGKSKKRNLIKNSSGPTEKVPLEKQLTSNGKVSKSKKKEKFHLRDEDEKIIDHKTSEKILNAAKKQQLEIFNPFSTNDSKSTKKLVNFSQHLKSTASSDDEDDNNISEKFDYDENINDTDLYNELKINAEDEKAIENFSMHGSGKGTKKLGDIIMEKIAEKQTDLNIKFSADNESIQLEEVDPKVREMYEGVRDVMKRYRSGKVPKAFKIIPKLRNWEQILYITEPHNWSAAAMYQGTRIFSPVLSQQMAQRFYNLVLLPRIRDDLSEFKRLNIHLYKALKKALFKPAAFMKGIVLPLLESGDCTLREAIIFGSIISRNTIPVLHSAACLLKICEMEYTGANSIFIRIFLDKRYALPYRVVDATVFHFLKFLQDKREMPVLWHQSFLSFVQRYKNDISSEQKEALFDLLRKKSHPKVTPDIRRELQAAKCRDVEMMEPDNIEYSIPNEEFTDEMTMG